MLQHLILLTLALPGLAYGQFSMTGPVIASPSTVTSPVLLSLDFEETGTPSPAPDATSGTINYDYTTSPAPLEGSESLYVLNGYAQWNIASQNELCASFAFYQSGSDSALSEYTLRGSVADQLTMLNVTGPDRLRFVHGATTINLNATVYGTPHYFWVRYVAETVPGSSADGVTQVWTNSAPSFSTAALVINNSAGTGDAVDGVRLRGNDAAVYVLYDGVVISTSTNSW